MKLPTLMLLSSMATVGLIAAFSGPQDQLDAHASALANAKSLTLTLTERPVSGGSFEEKVSYSKPNMLRIETPKGSIVTDGTTIWRYDKAANSYTEGPVTPEGINKIAGGSDVWAWAPFFVKDAYKNALAVKAGEKRNIKGHAVTEVIVTLPSERSATLFIDDQTGVAMGMTYKTPKDETLVVATDIKLGGDVLPGNLFAFKAPDGAKKVEVAVATAGEPTFADVSKIFANNCAGCHGGRGRGGWSTTSYDTIMAGGNSGKCITPGDPDASTILGMMKGTASPKMPPGGRQVPASDIQTISDWIKAGAKNN